MVALLGRDRAVSAWTRVGTAEEWELATEGPRWTIYRVTCARTLRNVRGQLWRGMREGVVLRKNHRVRSWRSRDLAMMGVELEAGLKQPPT